MCVIAAIVWPGREVEGPKSELGRVGDKHVILYATKWISLVKKFRLLWATMVALLYLKNS
jgi:hypothetical protein